LAGAVREFNLSLLALTRNATLLVWTHREKVWTFLTFAILEHLVSILTFWMFADDLTVMMVKLGWKGTYLVLRAIITFSIKC
jgi:hypothetical protein